MRMEEKVRAHAIVSGRVQGVGFRFFVQRTAVAMHIKGYVKNQADRTVLLEAQGSKDVLKRFLEAIRSGSGLAHVDQLNMEWIESRPDCVDFQIAF